MNVTSERRPLMRADVARHLRSARTTHYGHNSAIGILISCLYIISYYGISDLGAPSYIRYVVYLIPIATIVFLADNPIRNFDGQAFWFLCMYLLYCGVLYFVAYNEFYLNNVGIISLCIASFIPKIRLKPAFVDIIFVSCLLVFFAIIVRHGSVTFSFSFWRSASLSEAYDSNEGLLGAVYAIYYFCAGSIQGTLISILLIVLGGKRIGVGAFVLGIIAHRGLNAVALARSHKARFVSLLCLLAVANFGSIFLNDIVELAFENLDTDVHIEEFLAGRNLITKSIYFDLQTRAFYQNIFGSGAGASSALVGELTEGKVLHAHNDWIKIYYDYGIVGSIFFIVYFAFLFSKSQMTLAIGCVFAVLMVTDNVFIYLFLQVPIVFMFASERYKGAIT